MSSKKLHDELAKSFVDKGLLIEGGWRIYEHMVVPKDAPNFQRVEMRTAFFAGAQHLFASVMAILDGGKEPTEQDLKRMGQINAELEAFATTMKAKIG